MRQLIPRLLERLRGRSIAPKKIRPVRPPAKGAKSLRKPLPPPPVFFGRSRSILLDDVNPIMHPKAYRQHKSLPPQVSLPDSQKTRTVSRDGTVEDDVRREMTAEEREWWSNPYRMSPPPFVRDVQLKDNSICFVVRMLSTPLRRCAVSSRYLPTGMSSHPTPCPYDADRHTPDFMIRLSPKRLPSALTGPKRRYTLVPDGLQHPKFKGVDSSHRGCQYIACRRAALQEYDARGTTSSTHSQHKAALKPFFKGVTVACPRRSSCLPRCRTISVTCCACVFCKN